MGTIQQELFSRAAELVEHHLSTDDLLSGAWPEVLVVLSGSAPTVFADKFSSIDLVVVIDDATYSELGPRLEERGLGLERERFAETTVEGVRFKLAVYRESDVAVWLSDYDDYAMGLFHDCRPVHDPHGKFSKLIGERLQYPPDILAKKIRERFSELRRRQASMAWNLRRGQPFVFLDNLVRFMSHAFAICMHLEGRPPVGRKWLFRGAMRTSTGRRLRPVVFELFGLLGDLTTLGGTIHVRTSPLYSKVARLQELLGEAIEEAGKLPHRHECQ